MPEPAVAGADLIYGGWIKRGRVIEDGVLPAQLEVVRESGPRRRRLRIRVGNNVAAVNSVPGIEMMVGSRDELVVSGCLRPQRLIVVDGADSAASGST